jgi:hypothetical protein
MYLTFSEFARYPQIVGAVFADENGGLLFLNRLSPMCDRFHRSRLFQVFHEHEAVKDPSMQGDVYIADCPGSRRAENRQVLLRYVEEKYGVQPLIDVEPKHARSAIEVPWRGGALGEKTGNA